LTAPHPRIILKLNISLARKQKMKLKKLNMRGFSHDIVLLAIVIIFAIGGVGYLVASHADTPCRDQTLSQALGSSGQCVESLKFFIKLKDLDSNRPDVLTLTPNGSFDANTTQAVKNYQVAEGIYASGKATGVVDANGGVWTHVCDDIGAWSNHLSNYTNYTTFYNYAVPIGCPLSLAAPTNSEAASQAPAPVATVTQPAQEPSNDVSEQTQTPNTAAGTTPAPAPTTTTTTAPTPTPVTTTTAPAPTPVTPASPNTGSNIESKRAVTPSRSAIVGYVRGELNNPWEPKYGGTASESWCAFFATWAWRQAGVNIPNYGPVSDIQAWGESLNRWTPISNINNNRSTPQIGDAAIFGSAHVGIVTSVSGHGKNAKISIISGNLGNAVRITDSIHNIAVDYPKYFTNTQNTSGAYITGFVDPL
jgi:cell wall-associated NlpC family hydrolase